MKKIILGILIIAVVGAALYFGKTQLQKGSFGIDAFRQVAQQAQNVAQQQVQNVAPVADLVPVQISRRPRKAEYFRGPNPIQLLEVPLPNENIWIYWNDVRNENHILALPFEGDLTRVFGQNPCQRPTFGVEAKNMSSCQWKDVSGRTTKSVGRYAIFTSLEPTVNTGSRIENMPAGASLKNIQITARRLRNTPSNNTTGIHIFTISKGGNGRWEWQASPTIAANEHSKIIDVPMNAAYGLEAIVVARNTDYGSQSGAAYVGGVNVHYDYIAPERRANVSIMKRENNSWKVGGTVQDALAANGGFLSSDIVLPNGRKITVTLGQTKCMSDGNAATPLQDFTQGLPQAEVQGIAQKIAEATGQSMNDEVQDLMNGRRAADKKFIGVCDDTDRCKKSNELLKGLAGGSPFDVKGQGLFGAVDRQGRLAGDPRLMQGGGSTRQSNDPDGQVAAQNEFRDDALSGQPETKIDLTVPTGGVSVGDVQTGNVNNGDLNKIEISITATGSAAVTSKPYVHTNSPYGYVGYIPSGPGKTIYIGANDPNGQAALKALRDLANNPKLSATPREPGKGAAPKGTRSIPVTLLSCPPNDDKCLDKKVLENLKKSLETFDVLMRARGLPGLLDNQNDPLKMERQDLKGKLKPYVNPGNQIDGSDGLGVKKPQNDLEQCLWKAEKLVPQMNPGLEEFPQFCKNDCPQQEIAVGHSCSEIQENKIPPRPLATCSQNLLLGGRQPGAIDPPQDGSAAPPPPNEGKKKCPSRGDGGAPGRQEGDQASEEQVAKVGGGCGPMPVNESGGVRPQGRQ